MRIAIIGAGAIGGLFAARLARHDVAVSLLARGATLAALNAHGLRLWTEQGVRSERVRASDDAVALGVQDVVIVAIKATGVAQLANQITPLIGPTTVVVTAMNGVPWWFFDHAQVPSSGLSLSTLDPDGALRRAVPAAQIVGCVVHLSCTAPEPGLIRPAKGNRLILGEAFGAATARVTTLAQQLSAAGFDAEVSNDIRTDIWYKLWGNMTMNPLSAITGATCDRLLDDPDLRRFCLNAMAEAATIGELIGCPINQTGEERMQLTRQLGAFKTSMLQDALAGKPLEIDALVAAVQEIGRHLNVATPTIDSLLGLARVFARSHGLYPD